MRVVDRPIGSLEPLPLAYFTRRMPGQDIPDRHSKRES